MGLGYVQRDYLYCVYNDDSRYLTPDRNEAFEWYERNNGIRIETKTKDLFPTINILVDESNFDLSRIDDNDKVRKTSQKEIKRVEKYDKEHTKQVKMKLNYETDKDIIEYLNNCNNVQGMIKELIRSKMSSDNNVLTYIHTLDYNIHVA